MTAPSGRPLPHLTDQNAFFWTSGADGRLRIQECASCTALIHPPQPVCRYCHAQEMGVRTVSGRATLIGFTVSHRFTLPGLPSPYVVAQVALVPVTYPDGDNGRLTVGGVYQNSEVLGS
ncbi:zinc ribbon domain-containing protein, partial [Streptomyces sp. NPDC005921]